MRRHQGALRCAKTRGLRFAPSLASYTTPRDVTTAGRFDDPGVKPSYLWLPPLRDALDCSVAVIVIASGRSDRECVGRRACGCFTVKDDKSGVPKAVVDAGRFCAENRKMITHRKRPLRQCDRDDV
jgi:hypothetical protein